MSTTRKTVKRASRRPPGPAAKKRPAASADLRSKAAKANRQRTGAKANRAAAAMGGKRRSRRASEIPRPQAIDRREEEAIRITVDSSAAPFRCGTVSVAGRPNAGKSTLVNALVGDKVAIVAPTAQTTRTSVRGIANLANAQVIFTDTPGIHKSDSPLNRRMMDAVRDALEGQDLVVFVADASRELTLDDEQAVSALRHEAPCVLVLNKIDRIADKRAMLPLIESYSKLYPFAEVFPVSAKTGEGLRPLLEALVARMPEGPAIFPADQYTDQPTRFLAAEFVRERVLLATRQEVPHAVAVLIEAWEEKPLGRAGRNDKSAASTQGNGQLTSISATILVERPGQKKILIGKQGAVLKKIGTEARLEIEKLVGGPVFLALFVKVQPNWREDPEFLDAVNWRSMVGSR